MTLGDFKLTPGAISFHSAALSRPECVVAERDGTLWCSDDRGGLTRIGADGRVSTIGSIKGAPNGFAAEKGGSFLIANIEDGKVHRLYRNGLSEVVLDTFDGKKLGSANFVYRDGDRYWITISTRTEPRRKAMEESIADGFVLLYENGKARLAAQDIVFTNEVRIDRARKHLYVAETGKGRVLRYALKPDGTLGPAETYGPETMFAGARIDGITFDAEGNLWVTEITRNGLYVIAPNGNFRQIFEDPSGQTIDFPASVVFADPDLKTAYIGSIRMKRLAMFRSPVAGEPLDHWND